MKRILLIDDDDSVRIIVAHALRRSGYQVTEASSGPEGFEMALRQLPDLILSDVHMPGGGGEDLLAKIRQTPELSTRQVVLMTGDAAQITPRRGMEAGADDFLIKPVSLADLLSCVESRLKRAETHWRVEDRMLTTLRSSLLSTLPHEFFTPLAGILGLSEILNSDFETLSPDEVRDINRDIHQSALRLHRTLKNYLLILDLQNSVEEAPAPVLDPAALDSAIRAGIELAVKRHERAADVTTEIAPASLAIRAGDLSLILEELLDNACKFSRKGTPIVVRLEADGALVVVDQGRGMAAEQIQRIGAFQQFDRKKHEQQGLGLGLVLVQKLGERYGATISVVSHAGEGTQVRVNFPRPALA